MCSFYFDFLFIQNHDSTAWRTKQEERKRERKKNEELVIISIVHLGKHSLRNSHIDETNFLFYVPSLSGIRKRKRETERGREEEKKKI